MKELVLSTLQPLQRLLETKPKNHDTIVMTVLYYRSAVTTALSTLCIVLNPKLRQCVRHLPSKDQITLFKAGASCAGAVSLAAISLQYILAGNTSALLNTASLFVYHITYLQTRMGVTRTDIISILLGLCGILLITLPHLVGFAIGLTAAWCNGLCMIYSKHAAVSMHVILPVLAEEGVLLGCCLVSGGMDVRLSAMRKAAAWPNWIRHRSTYPEIESSSPAVVGLSFARFHASAFAKMSPPCAWLLLLLVLPSTSRVRRRVALHRVFREIFHPH